MVRSPHSPNEADLHERLTDAKWTTQAFVSGQVDAMLDPPTTSAVMLQEAQEDLRRLNDQLRRSEARFRSVIENVAEVISILEVDGTIRYISPSVRRVLGYEPDEQTGRQSLAFVHPDDLEPLRTLLEEAVVSGRTAALVPYRYRHKDGTWRNLESTALNLLDDDAVGGIVVSSRDVTDRVHAEGRYRALFDNMVEGFAHCVIVREDGTPSDFVYLEVNREFERLTGLKDVVGRRISELVPAASRPDSELFKLYARVAAFGGKGHIEAFVPGLERWFSVSVYGAGPDQFIAVFDNITERKQIEERLRRSEAEYRSLVEHAPVAIYRATPDGRLLTVNPALVALLGYDSRDELLTRNLDRDVYVDASERRQLVREAVLGGRPSNSETRWKTRDGRVITVRVFLHPVMAGPGEVEYLESLVVDLTEQRSLERQFLQAQKMEAVGRLAGGVAHDFNNLLTAIIGFSELIDNQLPQDSPVRGDVSEIRAAADRATALTRQLLAFSRKQVLQAHVLDLDTVVLGIENMLRRLIGEDIVLDVAPSGLGLTVRADPGQLEQVIVNLAVNARDAMPNGGRLRIESGGIVLDEPRSLLYPPLTPGDYATLTVTDTGVGMSDEVRSHLFEPFFTTKEQGKGTGLGLATVYGIVRQSGGHILACSEIGRGTSFTIFLPRFDEPTAATRVTHDDAIGASGGETVLVAEDDDRLRAVVARMLSKQGYTLLLAPHGAAALELARTHGAGMNLLVTDLVMPGMTGRELADRMHRERPDIRVLFTSGYTDDIVFRQGLLQPGVHYLQKPFTGQALARKVREVLNTPT